jgi:hemoglobin
MRTRLLVSTVLVVLGVAAFACGGKKPPPREPAVTETIADAGPDDEEDAEPPPPKSLYERMGGQEAIAKVVDDFTKNLLANDVTKKRFAKIPKERLERFKAQLASQICEASGGDCEYTGKDMKEAHKGMKITNAEWDATVSALKAALDENEVGETEQSDLIAILAPMREDIVDPKAKK